MTEGNDRPSYTQLAQEVLHQLGRIEGKLDAFDARLRAVENQAAVQEQRAEVYIPMFERLRSEYYEQHKILRDDVQILKQESLTSRDKNKARLAFAVVLVGMITNLIVNLAQHVWNF